ncbi:alpha-(1,6)-fucosyltransferase-like [Pecten maximus]|uniref:alpha-(1,6)-fucosyltransferase-like n=1 Tax=Pecten maximus TaxID=6579 RepID=UPI001457E7F1|nr:alpha-(1,6)-fucosyltransferase-like [Pecten maximus]
MKTWKVIGCLLLVWLGIMVYMSNILFQSSDSNPSDIERQLKRALRELDKLKAQNDEFRGLVSDIKNQIKTDDGEPAVRRKTIKDIEKAVAVGSSKVCEATGPSLLHEQRRRKIENDVVEFWYYMRSELKKLKSVSKSDIVHVVDKALLDGADYQKTLHKDFHALRNVDNAGELMKKESQELGQLVQRRFKYLQNPSNCDEAKKLVCNLSKGCGYGCQLHHVTYCMMVAYATQRTLILESRGWRYASSGWESVFLPLSDTCRDKKGGSSRPWADPDIIRDTQVVEMPIVDSLHPRPNYLPLAIPKDLSERLMRLHGDPAVWWIGQFVKYLTRPQPRLQTDMDNAKAKLGFSKPIVGVHVRRTDKVGTEAAFHSIDEYMIYVDEYYDRLEAREPVRTRKVYLASDDPSVLPDAKTRYPHYEFISDLEITKSAGLNKRYTDQSLHGIIMDIHFLSLSDYLVCTFSSQVCRVAYEMMQTMHADASSYFKSLDDIYYFGGQNGHQMEVLEKYVSKQPKEIDMEPGDSIGIAGNHWDGYSKGMNRRTGKDGLFPSYKTQSKVVIVDLPTYSEVDSQNDQ